MVANVFFCRVACVALLSLFNFTAFTQGSVPFRIGDKFGIAELSGKMVVPAEYDYIETESYFKLHFIAYKFRESGNLSSLIINNKVVIKDQPFRSYSFSNDLIVGDAYEITQNRQRTSDPFKQTSRLFDVAGNDVLDESFAYISVISEIDEENKLNEVLVITTDSDSRESILIYDKKQRKIVKTVASGVTDFEVPAKYNPSDNESHEIVYVYRNQSGNRFKTSLTALGKVIAVKTDKIEPVAMRDRIYDNFSDNTPVPRENKGQKLQPVGELPRKVKISLDYFYLPKKMEKIEITDKGFKDGYFLIITDSSKQGLQTSEGKTIIPARYDEVLEAEFDSRAGGHLMRNGNTYGMYIYTGNSGKIIEPVFTKIPLVTNESYFGTGKPLIMLFDDNGQFFCYADITGKMFYKEK